MNYFMNINDINANNRSMGKRFIIYGLLGWCLEIFWTGLNSLLKGDIKLIGFSSIWMFPIYGLAMFLEIIHNRIRNLPIIERGVVYTLLIFFIEFTTGWVLKFIIGACPWDYSSSSLSISGIIRLDFAPLWFATGLLFEKVHDTLLKYEIKAK